MKRILFLTATVAALAMALAAAHAQTTLVGDYNTMSFCWTYDVPPGPRVAGSMEFRVKWGAAAGAYTNQAALAWVDGTAKYCLPLKTLFPTRGAYHVVVVPVSTYTSTSPPTQFVWNSSSDVTIIADVEPGKFTSLTLE